MSGSGRRTGTVTHGVPGFVPRRRHVLRCRWRERIRNHGGVIAATRRVHSMTGMWIEQGGAGQKRGDGADGKSAHEECDGGFVHR